MHASGLVTNHRLSKKDALQDYNAPFIHSAFLAQVLNHTTIIQPSNCTRKDCTARGISPRNQTLLLRYVGRL